MLLHMKIIALGLDCIIPTKNTLRHERNATVIYTCMLLSMPFVFLSKAFPAVIKINYLSKDL